MKKLLLLATVLMTPVAATAQTASELGTYVATMRTPIGALAPILTNTLIDRLQNGASLVLRYGHLGEGDFNRNANAFGVTGILPAGLGSSLRVTGGVILTDQNSLVSNQAAGQLMLSAGGDLRLIGSSMGETATSPLWTISLDGELGYGNRSPGTFFSGYVGAPIALVQRGTGMQFSPFITPGFAFARTSANGSSEGGAGLLLGGGLGVYTPESSVIINVGAQHSFMNGARNTIGLNVIIGGK